eukprot:m51a1_g39 hypothetical protein (691) ;mRNA; r:143845-146966
MEPVGGLLTPKHLATLGAAGYRLVSLLGSGSFSVVFRGTRDSDGAQCAIKVIDISKLRGATVKYALSELDITSRLSHPNIVACLDVIREGGREGVPLTMAVIVMELCDGSLEQYAAQVLPEPGPRREAVVRGWCGQLAQGLYYLWQSRVMHRDLKLANIFYKRDPQTGLLTLKIADLGLSREADVGQSYVGTLLTMAPEVMHARRDQTYTLQVDIWSFGVIAYELLVGKGTVDALTRSEFREKMDKMAGGFELPGDLPYSDECRRFVAKLLRENVKERASFPSLLDDPFLRPDAVVDVEASKPVVEASQPEPGAEPAGESAVMAATTTKPEGPFEELALDDQPPSPQVVVERYNNASAEISKLAAAYVRMRDSIGVTLASLATAKTAAAAKVVELKCPLFFWEWLGGPVSVAAALVQARNAGEKKVDALVLDALQNGFEPNKATQDKFSEAFDIPSVPEKATTVEALLSDMDAQLSSLEDELAKPYHSDLALQVNVLFRLHNAFVGCCNACWDYVALLESRKRSLEEVPSLVDGIKTKQRRTLLEAQRLVQSVESTCSVVVVDAQRVCKNPMLCPLCFWRPDEQHCRKFMHACLDGESCTKKRSAEHMSKYFHLIKSECTCSLVDGRCPGILDPVHRFVYRHAGYADFLLPCTNGEDCTQTSDFEHCKNFCHCDLNDLPDLERSVSVVWL